jgi:hypothetical protein
MLFNVIFNTTQTIILFFVSPLYSIFTWWIIHDEINYNYGKQLRKSTYYRKKWIAKLFLLGAEYFAGKLNTVVNYIEKISSIILVLFCGLNLIFCFPIFSDMMIIFGMAQFVAGLIIDVENYVFVVGHRK